MKATNRAFAFSVLLLCTLPGHAQSPAPTGSGAEPAIAYSDPSLATHTIYRPASLQTGKRYPLVLWGNGSCVNSNFGYREFLAEVASHGFVVLALGPWRDTPAPRQQRPADPAAWPEFETQSQQLLAGLDWATAEAARYVSDRASQRRSRARSHGACRGS